VKLLDKINQSISEFFVPFASAERNQTVQPTDEERKEYKRLMRKHGLLDGKTLITEEPGMVPYFYRDGQRIKFK
jgi:hypothetical protein